MRKEKMFNLGCVHITDDGVSTIVKIFGSLAKVFDFCVGMLAQSIYVL